MRVLRVFRPCHMHLVSFENVVTFETMLRITTFHFKPCHMYSISFQAMQYVSVSRSNQQYITACDCRPCSICFHRKCHIAGFFENKEADAKARGQKLPKKKDPKQEYDNFLKSIADDVQEVEARQEVEAVEAAQDKADQEAFEHGCALGLCVCCTSQLCVKHTHLALVL